MNKETRIGKIENYYGGLYVMEDASGVCFWGIENYNGITFEEIPRYLYDTLLRYQLEAGETDK